MSAARKVLVLGATSLIAQECARNFARDKSEFYLVSRSLSKLDEIKSDLSVLGAASVQIESAELGDLSKHQALIQNIINKFAGFDTVLLAYGSLGDQTQCESDVNLTLSEIQVNFTSAVSLLTLIANYFEKNAKGTIAVITSVAGDRGRKKNYVYGSAKAGLSVYLQGLRNRFGKSNIQVLTVKPGFVDTPMTKDFKKGLLFASAEKVGADIYRAILKGKDSIYTPSFWGIIMLIIKLIPERVFKKLNI